MRRFWNFRNDVNQPEDGVLTVDGVLMTDDWWDDDDGVTSSRAFKKALAKYRNVTVVINSPGGDVMAGAEMYSALREHSTSGKGRVTVKITALAASAASVVAMAGDEILMSPVAYMMVHNPWSFMAGNADDMRKEADALDEIAEGIINAYQLRTHKSRAKLKELMDGESYMNARRCIAEGFADGLLYEAPMEPDEEEPEEDDPDEEEGVLMKAKDFGIGRAVACAIAHGMKVNPLRTRSAKAPNAAEMQHEDSLEDEIRLDIAMRAEMIASLF